MGRLCTWEREAGRLVIRDGGDAAVLVPDGVDGRALRPTGWFAFCRDSPDLAADRLDLLDRGPHALPPDVG